MAFAHRWAAVSGLTLLFLAAVPAQAADPDQSADHMIPLDAGAGQRIVTLQDSSAGGGGGGGEASELRNCFSRPTLVDGPCLVNAGHVAVETGLVEFSRDSNADERDDELDLGVLTLRAGLSEHNEITIDWNAAYARDRTLDRTTGDVERTSSVGDVRVMFRHNFQNPDGESKGFSWGVLPYVMVPLGRTPVGDGDWGYGVIVPFGFPLNDKVSVAFSPSVQELADEDGHGQHANWGGVASLGLELSDQFTLDLELSEHRDADPEEHTTESLAAIELETQPRDGLQLDAGIVAGLNDTSPDIRLLTGIAVRF